MPGMIYTFYSYKGGVGRSMALANIGMYFYLQGYTTLLVDWDLEAPGLERYFEKRFNLNVSDIIERPGIIDLIKDYKELSLQPLASEKVDEEQLFPDLDKYLFALDQAPKKKLFLLHAGRRSPGRPWSDYTSFVQAFDWANFYDEWEGGAFIDWLREQFKQKADIILIDSRTGVTEVGGVATQHLADVVLLICGSNLENIESTARMARNFASEQVKEARNGRPLDIMVVPSRIDNSDTDGYGEFLKRIENTVKELPVAKSETGQRLTETIIPYFPAFSYRETLIFGDEEAERLADQLVESYLRIAENMQILNLSKRYERSKAQEKRGSIFLSYSHRDNLVASQIKLALGAAGYQVQGDESEIKGGQEWASVIEESIKKADLIVSIISHSANESSWVRRELVYADNLQKPIVPIKVDDSPIPLMIIDRQYISAEANFEDGLQELIAVLPKRIEALAERDAYSVSRQLELDYLDDLLLRYSQWTELYVPLPLEIQKPDQRNTKIDVEKFFKDVKSKQQAKLSSSQILTTDVMSVIDDLNRFVLLGEAGSGKTTTLQRVAIDYASHTKENPSGPIPILVPIRELRSNLIDLIRLQLGKYSQHIQELIDENRVVLLLDGLDEVAIEKRQSTVEQISQFLESHPKLPTVVTSRLYTYEAVEIPDLARVIIRPLDSERIFRFINNYLEDQDAKQLFQVLNETQLVELGKSPLMLFMLLQLYVRQGKLPQNRVQLYSSAIDILLRIPNSDHIDAQLLQERLSNLAFTLQTNPDKTSISRSNAMDFLKDEKTLSLARSTGLLLGDEELQFSHRAFQEYLASTKLDRMMQSGTLASELFPKDKWWNPTGLEESLVLLTGLYTDDCTPVLEWLSDAQPELTARCVRESGANAPAKTLDHLGEQWLPRLTDLSRDSNPNARAAIGRALGLLGLDNRKGAGCVAKDGIKLPDIGWCEIPGGQFLMGSDPTRTPEAFDQEKPQQAVGLPTYYISRYPITCTQYQSFVADGGYQNKRYWISSGWKWKTQEEVGSPLYSDDSNWHISNHPIVGISWYEAYAFTRWLSEKLGVEIRLPTEPEWEKAARGTDGRKYPWGDSFSEDNANIRVEKPGYSIMRTSPVGIYPQGASPFGVLDMCGNVLEWCLNEYITVYPYNESLDINSDKQRPARGGSWSTDAVLARSAARSGFLPHSRFNYLGFRVITLHRF